MAKFKLQATAEDVQQALEDKGEFITPPPGYYWLKVVEANAGFSKTDGEEDQTKPRVEMVYEIVGEGTERSEPKANYGRIWDYLTFGKDTGWQRAAFARAFGIEVVEGQDVDAEMDTDELIERVVFARLRHEKDKMKSEEEKKTVMRARVGRLLPPPDADGFSAAEASGDAYAGAEDSPADGNPFEETAEELLTEEELAAMDPKELGAVAKEFDLDPNDLVVKVKGKVDVAKSKAAIIAAVLEAQGGEDDPEPGDDESPF